MKRLELSYLPLLNTKNRLEIGLLLIHKVEEKSSIEIGLMMTQVEKFTTAYLDTRGGSYRILEFQSHFF
mgnify:CR=1 FL=1